RVLSMHEARGSIP
ncbi:hypothetical protein KIPB_016740, partial [Kipferlia bialata]